MKLQRQPVTTSQRNNPQLQAIFNAMQTQARHLRDDEYEEYIRVLPDSRDRAIADREVGQVVDDVVVQNVDEILTIYPFEKYHEMARVKGVRDLKIVCAYASLSMLMNDSQWFDDKLLIWLRTINTSFKYPDRETGKPKALFSSGLDAELEKLPPHMRPTYETYYKLGKNFEERLSSAAFAIYGPYITHAMTTLTSD